MLIFQGEVAVKRPLLYKVKKNAGKWGSQKINQYNLHLKFLVFKIQQHSVHM